MNEYDILTRQEIILENKRLSEAVAAGHELRVKDRATIREQAAEIERLREVMRTAKILGEVVFGLFEDLNIDDTLCVGDWEQPLREAYAQLSTAGEQARLKASAK